MSNNELQKILDNIPAKSYKDKVKQIEDYIQTCGNINTLLQMEFISEK